MCRRPESKTGRMLHIPNMNNMCICIDCMERSFRVMDGSNYADLMQGMNIQDLFPGGMNMDDMMNVQNQIPKRQKLKKKAKDDEKVQPEFDIKNIPAPHILKAKLDEYVIGQDRAKKAIAVAVYNHYKRVATNTMDDIEIGEVQHSHDRPNRMRQDIFGQDTGKTSGCAAGHYRCHITDRSRIYRR